MGSLLCSSHVPVASSPHSPARPLLLDDRKPNAFTRNEASEVPSAGARAVDDTVRPSSRVMKSIQY